MRHPKCAITVNLSSLLKVFFVHTQKNGFHYEIPIHLHQCPLFFLIHHHCTPWPLYFKQLWSVSRFPLKSFNCLIIHFTLEYLIYHVQSIYSEVPFFINSQLKDTLMTFVLLTIVLFSVCGGGVYMCVYVCVSAHDSACVEIREHISGVDALNLEFKLRLSGIVSGVFIQTLSLPPSQPQFRIKPLQMPLGDFLCGHYFSAVWLNSKAHDW